MMERVLGLVAQFDPLPFFVGSGFPYKVTNHNAIYPPGKIFVILVYVKPKRISNILFFIEVLSEGSIEQGYP